MRELSLHILDIAENSVKAKASLIKIDVIKEDNTVTIRIADNGSGMDAEFLKRVTDPFTTTRSTRKVGMGIPLFKLAAEAAGGTFDIKSKKDEGTVVTATFVYDNIDRAPLGDLPGTILTLINDDTDFVWTYRVDGQQFVFDTREVRAELGEGISLTNPQITAFLKELLKENINSLNSF